MSGMTALIQFDQEGHGYATLSESRLTRDASQIRRRMARNVGLHSDRCFSWDQIHETCFFH